MRKLKDYEPFLRALFQTICDDSRLITDQVALEDILRNPRLIVALNHATPLSWIPAISYLTSKVVQAGGGDRVPVGIIDKFFFSNPLTIPFAEYISQSRTPKGFAELLSALQSPEPVDLAVFPEGALTFFGSLNEIQPFRSPRIIELSIRSGVPILLCVHRGSETWNLNLSVPPKLGSLLMPISQFFGRGLIQNGSLNLPVNLKKIPKFSMKLHLYSPALYEADLSADPTELRFQLEQEAEQVREMMQEMWESLGEGF